MTRTIYLDHNSTTPLLPEAFEAMTPYLTPHHGNASSMHRFGREARDAIEVARDSVAAAIGARSSEVIFTSGGTESLNSRTRCVSGVTPSRARPRKCGQSLTTASADSGRASRCCAKR